MSSDSLTPLHAPPGCTQVTLGKRIDVPVFEMGTDAKPADIAAKGVNQAKKVQLACVFAFSPAADALMSQKLASIGNNACQHRSQLPLPVLAQSILLIPLFACLHLCMYALRALCRKLKICW